MALVPEFLGVLLMEIFLPDGQGEKAENPDVYSGYNLQENPIFPSPCFHRVLNSKLQVPNPKEIQKTNFDFSQEGCILVMDDRDRLIFNWVLPLSKGLFQLLQAFPRILENL